jgi:hypothetical protein
MTHEALLERLRKLSAYGCCLEAADLIEEMQAEEDLTMKLVARQGDLLRETAEALHGGKLHDGLWSHHDLPDIAAKMRQYLTDFSAAKPRWMNKSAVREWLKGLKS